MKEKPLLSRFALLAGLIGLAVLVVLYMPLKKGMDLEGGHSLTFKVDTGGKRSVVNKVIDTLKERVDPAGVRNLEWRPVVADRFEVRMPVGSKKARAAQEAYMKAIGKLTERNISPALLRRIVAAEGEARKEMIAAEVGAADPRAEMLTAAADLQDKAVAEEARIADELKAKEAKLAALRAEDPRPVDKIDAAQTEIDVLTENRDLARGEYRAKIRQLQKSNLRAKDVTGVMSLYDPPAVAAQMAASDVEERKKMLAERLAALEADYPDVSDPIAEVAELYKAWANDRGRLDDPEDLTRLIAQAGVLEFRIAPVHPKSRREKAPLVMTAAEAGPYLQDLSERGPQPGRDRQDTYQWFKIRDAQEAEKLSGDLVVGEWGRQKYVLLSNEAGNVMLLDDEADPWRLTDAGSSVDQNTGGRAVSFTLDDRGARKFGALTGAFRGQPMAILLDDEVYSAPTIQSQINRTGVITGKFTSEEQSDLIRTLAAGSLKARVNPNPVAVDSIGPTLGQANIIRGQRAAVYGLIGVLVFMAAYYLLAGFIADFALVINILLILAAMAAFEVIFTLPGIAGLILTIGIAVDANVLIFERLREEQLTAVDLGTAIRNAYQRALTAIVDGNVTTLLVCAILYWVGTQEIKGFAATLGIGIVISLFTSLLVTRWVFRLLNETGLLKGKVHMMRLVGTPNINWFNKRKIFWAFSAILIVVGVASLIERRDTILGIEFSTGTRAVIRLSDDALLDGKLYNDAMVADALKAAGAEMNVEGLTGQSVQVNELKTESRVEDFIAAYDAITGGNGDQKVSLSEWLAQGREPQAFEELGGSADTPLDATMLAAALPEPRYQITTSEENHIKVREVINAAFKGKLNTLTALNSEVISGGDLGGLRIGSDGYVEITQSLVEAAELGPEFRIKLEDNLGGVLMAFRLNDSAEALTPAELVQRLTNTRLQAGREEMYVATPAVLPLKAVGDGVNRYVEFAVAVRTEDVPPRNRNVPAWEKFAASEVSLLNDALASERSLESLSNFDSSMTKKTTGQAIIAIVLSWIAIIGYVWFRFGSVQWGLAAVVCLVHDTLVVIGLVAACGFIADTSLGKALLIEPFKIDLAVIAAILTVIGYSVNDTIVVFDRIRENRKKSVKVTPAVLNRSINQTLARTVLTSCTTLIVVVTMYIWGGDGIHGFSFTLLVGILFGTYSSVAIASPLLLGFKQAFVAKASSTPTPE